MGVLESQVTRSWGSCIAGAFLAATVSTGALAANQSVSAPGIKAAYLYNFVQFVEWPAEVPPAGVPFALCIVDDDAVANALEKTIKGRNVDGRSLAVRRLDMGAPLSTCHVVFFSASHQKQMLNVLGALSGKVVLTVSNAPRFARIGGMVELFVEDGRMRIAVNVDALQRSGVRLSSRVLQLAVIVRDATPQ